ncbi:MAG TPA: DUF2231 domain-containing protein, partial [Solirubrobacteraceae bacterium]
MNLPQMPTRQQTRLESFVHQVESTQFLDAPAKAAGRAIRSTIGRDWRKDLLSGTWLGHAVHPLLTDVVIGSFMSASLLDLLAGRDGSKASERLIVIGIAAYTPTALTGVNDWADTEPADHRVRRVGVVHASSNALALGLYSASLALRRNG